MRYRSSQCKAVLFDLAGIWWREREGRGMPVTRKKSMVILNCRCWEPGVQGWNMNQLVIEVPKRPPGGSHRFADQTRNFDRRNLCREDLWKQMHASISRHQSSDLQSCAQVYLWISPPRSFSGHLISRFRDRNPRPGNMQWIHLVSKKFPNFDARQHVQSSGLA